MPLPELTHLQFLVLTALLGDEKSGRELRDKLAEEGESKSGPAFYQMMARMEDGKLVDGWYEQKIVEGQIIKERRYRLTAAGVSACEQTLDFYRAYTRKRRLLFGGLEA